MRAGSGGANEVIKTPHDLGADVQHDCPGPSLPLPLSLPPGRSRFGEDSALTVSRGAEVARSPRKGVHDRAAAATLADMRPVAAFSQQPLRLWQAHGLDCAIYAGTLGSLNGYVRLPENHLDWQIADALDAVGREQRLRRFGRDLPAGYDFVDVDVHGGLTYGPDEEGWVGFDTAHHGDLWPIEELLEHLKPVDEEAFSRAEEVRLILGELGGLAGVHGKRWTFGDLQAEVENLARQLAHIEAHRPV